MLKNTGDATLGYYRCSADMLSAWEAGGVTVDMLKVLAGRQGRQNLCGRASRDSRGTRRWPWAGTTHCATSSAQSFSLQISTSVRKWATLSPCAEVAPARTQRAPTAASACQATWPWPGHTTACPRQPRTQQLRSSRRAGVKLLPCTWLWDLGAQRKASHGCGCFEALCSFAFEVHSFPTISLYRSGLSSQPLHPSWPCQPQLFLQQSSPRPSAPSHCPVMEAHRTPSLATQLLPVPLTLQERGFISLPLLH